MDDPEVKIGSAGLPLLERFEPKRPRRPLTKDKAKMRKAVKMRAEGATHQEVAAELGCAVSSAKRIMSKQAVKDMIEEQSQRLLKLVPDAINNVEGLVKDFRATKIVKVKGKKGQEDTEIEVPVLGSDDRKLAYDATKKVLEAPGLLSGGAVSVQIGKLTVNTQTNIISPNVLDLLKKMSTTVPVSCDTEAIECEVIEPVSELPEENI